MNYYFIQVVKHETQPVSDVTKEIEGKLREEKFKATLDNIKSAANIWLDPKYFPPVPAPGAASAANAPATTSSAQPAPAPAQKPN
jgi:hypothetical protein